MTNAGTVEIEVFRVGPASRGIGATEVDQAIAAYDAEKAPAPLVFGHPTSDKPAQGWISGLRRDGDKLLATLKDISAEAIDKVKAKAFRNRSIAFWHPDHSANPAKGQWGIRHLGLLGAAQPGIPNMTPLRFSADESAIEGDEAPEAAVIFAEKAVDSSTETVIIEEVKVADKDKTPAGVDKTQFDALTAENERLKTEAKARQEADEKARKDANVKFVDGLVEKGKVTPGFKGIVAAALNALPVTEVQFDADTKGDPVEGMRKFLAALPEQVRFEVLSPTGERQPAEQDPQAIADKAVAFQAEQEKLGRNVSTADAVQQVMKGTGK